jgi:hypothetical protein
MTLKTRSTFFAAALCALCVACASITECGPIITLDLGGGGTDIAMNGRGLLSTVSDGDVATLGDQNTGVTYADFLAALFPNISPPPSASFTLSGLQATGAAQVPLPGLVIQNFTGGSFSLYAPNNSLLLQGPIASAALSGVIGPPGTGGLFTTSLGSATAGSLKDYFQAGTLSVSMNLTTVNGGGGFVVTPPATGGVLSAFTANAVAGIAGSPGANVPEPASIAFVLVALAGAASVRARSRC